MDIIRVETWAQLEDVLFEGSWDTGLQRHRSPFAFRGLPTAAYDLKTSLLRLAGPIEQLERHLLRNFQKYARREVVEKGSYWYWLSVAQHHGLPTRLLDWTFSPFVAMHFVTERMERFDEDGAIWAVDFVRMHPFLPPALRRALRKEGSNVFTVEMLNDQVRDLDHLQQLSADPFVVFFEPPSIDDRIVNQFALFSFMSEPQTRLDEWLERHPGLWRKIVIPAELKWEIRDRLDQANITERVLFPGLDGLSKWLTRHYSPRR